MKVLACDIISNCPTEYDELKKQIGALKDSASIVYTGELAKHKTRLELFTKEHKCSFMEIVGTLLNMFHVIEFTRSVVKDRGAFEQIAILHSVQNLSDARDDMAITRAVIEAKRSHALAKISLCELCLKRGIRIYPVDVLGSMEFRNSTMARRIEGCMKDVTVENAIFLGGLEHVVPIANSLYKKSNVHINPINIDLPEEGKEARFDRLTDPNCVGPYKVVKPADRQLPAALKALSTDNNGSGVLKLW